MQTIHYFKLTAVMMEDSCTATDTIPHFIFIVAQQFRVMNQYSHLMFSYIAFFFSFSWSNRLFALVAPWVTQAPTVMTWNWCTDAHSVLVGPQIQ